MNGAGPYPWTQFVLNPIAKKAVVAASNDPYGWPEEDTTYSWSIAQFQATEADGARTTYHFTSHTPLDNTAQTAYEGLVTEVDYPNTSSEYRTWMINPPPATSGVTDNAYVQNQIDVLSGYNSGRIVNSIDLNGNVTSETEYDWGSSSSASTPGGPAIRTTVTGFVNNANGGTGATGYYTSGAATQVWRSAVASRAVFASTGGTTPAADAQYVYDQAAPDPKEIVEQQQWDSTKASSPPSSLGSTSAVLTDYGYDGNGNVTSITTPGRSNTDRTTNQYGYDSSGTYLNQIDRAYNTGFDIRTSFTNIDPATGLVISSIGDTVNNVTTMTAHDDLGRPTLVREAAGSSLERQTALSYSVQSREYCASVVHPPFCVAAVPGQPDPFLPKTISNRKTRNHPQTTDIKRLPRFQKSLAGH